MLPGWLIRQVLASLVNVKAVKRDLLLIKEDHKVISLGGRTWDGGRGRHVEGESC